MRKRYSVAAIAALFIALSQWPGSTPALAQSGGSNDASFLVSGSSGETYELAIHLRATAVVDGATKLMAPDDCQLIFTLEADDAAGSDFFKTQVITLDAGSFDTFVVPFSDLIEDGTAHARIQISNVTRIGPCGSLLTERLSETSTGTTRIIRNFMSRRADLLLSDGTSDLGGNDAHILVSGNPTDESVELSFNLRKFAVVDGVTKLMSAAECEVAFSLRAVSLTGTGGDEIIDEVVLGPGELHAFKVPFTALGSGHALLELSGLHQVGPCEIGAIGRLVGKDGDGNDATKAAIAVPDYQTFADRNKSRF